VLPARPPVVLVSAPARRPVVFVVILVAAADARAASGRCGLYVRAGARLGRLALLVLILVVPPPGFEDCLALGTAKLPARRRPFAKI
jgi:hypothetical protein